MRASRSAVPRSILLTNRKVGTRSAPADPHGFGMALHAIVGAHHENRVVECLQCALSFGRKVNMARSIDEHEMQILEIERRLRRENRDTALALHSIGVQMRVTVIDAPRACGWPRRHRASPPQGSSYPHRHGQECPPPPASRASPSAFRFTRTRWYQTKAGHSGDGGATRRFVLSGDGGSQGTFCPLLGQVCSGRQPHGESRRVAPMPANTFGAFVREAIAQRPGFTIRPTRATPAGQHKQ